MYSSLKSNERHLATNKVKIEVKVEEDRIMSMLSDFKKSFKNHVWSNQKCFIKMLYWHVINRIAFETS